MGKVKVILEKDVCTNAKLRVHEKGSESDQCTECKMFRIEETVKELALLDVEDMPGRNIPENWGAYRKNQDLMSESEVASWARALNWSVKDVLELLATHGRRTT